MTGQEEVRMAWALWHMLTQLTDILWERYEDEFVRLCIESGRSNVWGFGRDDNDAGQC
jgi:hypothetical protein